MLNRQAYLWKPGGKSEPVENIDPKKTYAIRTELAYLRLGELDVACIPGEIYPELVLDKVQTPADPGADFPDAPVEPAIYKQLRGPHRMIDRPGQRRDRLHHPEAAVGRESRRSAMA